MASAHSALTPATSRAVAALQAGDTYEAQQLFKSTYHRQRKKGGPTEGAYDVLKEGAQRQLSAGQITCGVELALMLLNALEEDKVEPSTESLAYLLPIVSGLVGNSSGVQTAQGQATGGPPPLQQVEEAERVVWSVSSWASRSPLSAVHGLRKVHAAFAQQLWRAYGTQQLQRVAVHAARGDNTELYAQVLRTVAEGHDLSAAATEAVLQVLVLAQPDTLSVQLEIAKSLLAALSPEPGSGSEAAGGNSTSRTSSMPASARQPLFNFLALLLQALDKGSTSLVRLLRDRYQPALSTSEGWDLLLDKIEALFTVPVFAV